MNSEEMYERGVADAERGESHPFYYQHYYHYRRGYDQGRRRLRRSPLEWIPWRWWIIAAAVALALAAVALFGGTRNLTSTAEPVALAIPATSTTIPSPTPPTRTPVFPTTAPSATPEPIIRALRVNGFALVTNTEGRALRGRAAPGLKAPVRVAFVEGEQVQLLEGPVTADGYIWWRIEGTSGTAWAAQQSLEGVIWLAPVE